MTTILGMDANLLGAWIAVGLTLFLYSFLYKDNVFFKFAEHLYVGVSIGYEIVQVIFQSGRQKAFDPLFGEGPHNYWVIIPIFMGILLLFQLSSRYNWVSRTTFAAIMGFGSGVAIPNTIATYILPQFESTIKPLITAHEGVVDWSLAGLWNDFSNLVILVGVLSVLIYFFFSVEHKGVIRRMSRIGVFFLMVAFGAAFGSTIMARISLLIGRFDDLVEYGKADSWHATWILLPAIALLVVVTTFGKGGPREGDPAVVSTEPPKFRPRQLKT